MATITPETELLKGRTILVTGGASGLGRCTAYIAAYQGANVCIGDLNQAQAQETVDLIKKAFPHVAVSCQVCDVTSEQSVEDFVNQAVKTHGAVHGLAHCAGIFSEGKPFVETTVAMLEKELKVNGIGTFIPNRAMVRQIHKQRAAGVPDPIGGYSIVNTGSKASTAGSLNGTVYVASKHSVLGMSRCLAREEAKNNIRVNLVCPGPIDTPLFRNGCALSQTATADDINAKLNEMNILDAILLRKLGQPEDVAHQIIYMLGPRGAFMTHSMVEMDGGWI